MVESTRSVNNTVAVPARPPSALMAQTLQRDEDDDGHDDAHGHEDGEGGHGPVEAVGPRTSDLHVVRSPPAQRAGPVGEVGAEVELVDRAADEIVGAEHDACSLSHLPRPPAGAGATTGGTPPWPAPGPARSRRPPPATWAAPGATPPAARPAVCPDGARPAGWRWAWTAWPPTASTPNPPSCPARCPPRPAGWRSRRHLRAG